MRIDIYFKMHRFSICSWDCADRSGFVLHWSGGAIVSRAEVVALFEEHCCVTLVVDACVSVTEAYDLFASDFFCTTAAGGVLRNEVGELMFIFRNGCWDLPKGHLELGESLESCAVREVEEESGARGICAVTCDDLFAETVHAYYLHGRWELKRTHWYSMRSLCSCEELYVCVKPQVEEGIESISWHPADSALDFVSESYPTIQYVVSRYLSRFCDSSEAL